MAVSKDVTRRAVEAVGVVASKVLAKLNSDVLFTGPNNVMLDDAEVRKQANQGNTEVIRRAMQDMDEAQMLRLLGGQNA